jgi:hypothetical protein
MTRLILPRRGLLAAPALILPYRRAFAQGGMGPGPGTAHSSVPIWTLKDSTQFTGAGTNGGTTNAVDFTGVNLIIRFVAYTKAAGGSVSGVTDSSGNTWGAPYQTEPGITGNAFSVYFLANPTVSASQTFTTSGTNIFSAEIVVGWIDSLGTPTVDAGVQINSSASSTAAIHAGSSAYLPTVPKPLVVIGVSSYATALVVYTPDSGFTVSNQTSPTAAHAGGALSYLLPSSATSLDPIWAMSPAEGGGVATVMLGFRA